MMQSTTLTPSRGYAKGVLARGRKTMIYEILAQEMANDALRKAEKHRRIKLAKRSLKHQDRTLLAKLARLFRFTRTNQCKKGILRFENT